MALLVLATDLVKDLESLGIAALAFGALLLVLEGLDRV
jgi:hypothetical protein